MITFYSSYEKQGNNASIIVFFTYDKTQLKVCCASLHLTNIRLNKTEDMKDNNMEENKS